jgi:hypothetical protein
MFNKCGNNFVSQYAYINNICIHINDYIKNEDNIPLCKNNHKLVYCNGTNKKAYFRHKNKADTIDNKMTAWHCNWQGLFKNTEVLFKKNNDEQIKNRYADVLLSDDYILEIQHSNITDSEVICRTKDYSLHNKKLIWLIDGNDDILNILSDNTYLIEFRKEWKYKSFLYNYDLILLNIDDKIFKVPIKNFCNKMIHLYEYKDIDVVVDKLKNNPNDIWNLWKDINEIKPVLKIIQQGAGNGKTFGIWKTISLNFDKDVYFITTKQHTAKEVILQELNDQAHRKEYHIINNMEDLDDEKYGKQYKVTYKHKYSQKECVVYIGTIDSFIWALTSKSIGGGDYFLGLLNNICINGCDKVLNGKIKYSGDTNIKLNKMTEVWIDEGQDLPINYYKAIVKLMLETKIDVVIVGDKLQSLEYDKNFLTHIGKEENIQIIKPPPLNINRRIKVQNMSNIINELVDFTKYNLPEIKTDNKLDKTENEPIEYFEQKIVYAHDTDKIKIDNEINNIIDKVKYEINTHNYKPEDFLFIFPILKSNILACELETKLNKLWLDILGNDDEYKQYAILHKHEEGTVIDTSKSVNASRIMSIRSSKGDGRNVVFILNCTESSLKILSGYEKNIVYESYLHVALTRARRKIYFGLTYNNDDIYRRCSKTNENIVYIPLIKSNINIDRLIDCIDKNSLTKILEEQINELSDDENKETNNKIIDWEYHCIRNSVYYIYALFEIFKFNKNEELFKKSQLKVVLDKISRLKIQNKSPCDFYKYMKTIKNEDLKYIPLCNLSDKTIYKNYNKKITDIIIKIQNEYIKKPYNIGKLSPLEMTILVYLIDLFINKKYHTITPSTIYNIINSYDNENEIQKLIEESLQIKKIMKKIIRKNILNNNENINWNIFHMLFFNGKSKDFKIYKQFNIIGHDNYTTYHFVFQTDYNSLNYWDTQYKILLDRFLIRNVSGNNDYEFNNIDRFTGKKIITYLVILKKANYEIFDWDFEDNINDEIKNIFRDGVIKYFEQYNSDLFNYCFYVIKNKNVWKEYKSPFIFMEKHKDLQISYIQKFFDYLNRKSKTNNQYVKEIINSRELFYDKINEFITEMCDTYFNINNEEIDQDYDY